jgi:PPOX class probable F420-dependent enzyme
VTIHATSSGRAADRSVGAAKNGQYYQTGPDPVRARPAAGRRHWTGEDPDMTDLADISGLLAEERGLAVVATAAQDQRIAATVVNVAVMAHPDTGRLLVAFVSLGSARRLVHLRRRPRATVTVRSGWRWATVEGPVELIGPDDPTPGYDGPRLAGLLRQIFVAGGGEHDDWDEYDAVMVRERRTAVLVVPERIYSNG